MSPRRDHVVLAMVLGLLASLSIHLPVYGALGVLADKLLASGPRQRGPAADEGMMVEFDLAPEEPEAAEPEPEEEVLDESEGELDEESRAETPEAAEPEPEPEPEEEEEEPEEEAEPTLAAPTEPLENLHAVTQQSRDPSVEAPENPRFLAEENSRVEQETVARIRSLVQDDPDPNAGEPIEESQADDEGNADEELQRETQETEAPDQRVAGRELEAQEATTAREAGRTGGEGDGSERERVEAERARRASEGGREQAQETETIVVSDGIGTFTITRPRRGREGSGGGAAGGERRQGREGRRARGGGAGGAGPNLQIGWSAFEAVMGEERLAREREEYAQARLSKQRGRSRERRRRWRQFRSAIENYVAAVQPGNQTALNTAASPFAAFMAEVHRRIHVQFHRFLDGLRVEGPMSDPTLHTQLEIVFRGDGAIDRVGVVHTSGVLTFDLGAFSAVMDGQPYPTPPRSILSGDGKVYLHWSFRRDQPYCHVANAEPYILPNPPPTPGSGGPGTRLREGPEWGSVVPDDAPMNYGLGRRTESRPDADSDADSESDSNAESESESDSESDSNAESESESQSESDSNAESESDSNAESESDSNAESESESESESDSD